MKIGQLGSYVMDIAIKKLTRIAIDFGLGTRQCDQAAETLMCFSSIHIQPSIIADLKEVCHSVIDASLSPKSCHRHYPQRAKKKKEISWRTTNGGLLRP